MAHSTSFGEWLTEYRQNSHIQRAELAARIGCAVVTLRKIEMDERRPSRQMAEQLAEQLAIPPDQRQTFIKVARGELSVSHLPPPRSGSEQAVNLPHPTTSLADRSREIEEIRLLLSHPEVRLLTLTGAPGIGKTRLALEAARTLQNDFPDGIYFVTLAPLTDPELVLAAIAQTLQLSTAGRQSLAERLERHLRTRRTLLVLDNFEHLLASAHQLTRLLEATSQLKFLVTSRIALELSGEYRLIVLPLEIPPILEKRRPDLAAAELQARYSAFDLFIQRARAVKPGLVLTDSAVSAIAEICRKLDGLPLAIEFVAARAAYFTPQELLTQLVNHFPLMAGGTRDLPVRHLSLWHALDWSYSLLSTGDRKLFRKLSVFVGGCTLEAVQVVCESEEEAGVTLFSAITTLLNNSLLQRKDGDDGGSRFEMLGTVREYAFQQLTASGEDQVMRQKHAQYYLELAQAAEKTWDGPAEWEWLRRLIPERDNLRAVLRWALDSANAELALKLNAALFSFWNTCSSLSEARNWLEATLALPYNEEVPEILAQVAKVLNVAGYVTSQTLDNDLAYHYFERGLNLYRRLNDNKGIAWSIRGCAVAEMQRNHYEAAGHLLKESLRLCESSQDNWGLAWSLYAQAFLKLAQGNLQEANTSLKEALTHLRQQNMTFGIFRTLVALGYTEFELGDIAGAEEFFREALLSSREIPLLSVITGGLEGLAMVEAEHGRVLQAARLWGAAEAMRELTGQRRLHVFQRSYERVLTTSRSKVEASDWDTAWAQGRALTPAQALSEGLEMGGTGSTAGKFSGESILPL
ncbi:MAG TPA: AAA family ATPase [Chloroflexia bacterium]|nr:AAA family ATPase [Chloroflexia bacterium]